MILKRYGTQLHSVAPNFDARAMNEIGFQRTHELSLATVEFETAYSPVETHELTAAADAAVQLDAEQAVLKDLANQLNELAQRYNSGHVLVVLSEAGRDYPKLHEEISNIIIEGENKLYFHRTVDPPLRIGIFAPRNS